MLNFIHVSSLLITMQLLAPLKCLVGTGLCSLYYPIPFSKVLFYNISQLLDCSESKARGPLPK